MMCMCCPPPKVKRWARLHVGNRYIWVDFHPWLGPAFTTDSAGVKTYEPEDEHDPVWDEFGKWLEKYQAKTERAKQCKATSQ